MSDYPGYVLLKVMPRGEGKQVEILCGLLAGGIPAGRPAVLYPGGRELKIRRVEEDRDGDFRLVVKGISRSALVSGSVIVSASLPVQECREGLFLHDGGSVPAETEAIRGGLYRDFNRERLVGRGSFGRDGSFLSVRFPAPFPMVPGMQCSILNRDGSPRKLTLLWPGRPTRDEMRRLEADAPRRPNPHPEAVEIFSRILFTRGYLRLPVDMRDSGWKGITAAGDWLVRDSIAAVTEKKILKLASRPGGADKVILRLEGMPDGLILALADSMVAADKLTVRDGWYFPPGNPRLSPYHRGWLARVAEAGTDGLRISSLRSGPDTDALEVLARSGLIVGGNDLWFHPDSCDVLAAKLLDGLAAGDSLNMADARLRLEGNRIRSLEVLSILEKQGRLRRDDSGDGRTVV